MLSCARRVGEFKTNTQIQPPPSRLHSLSTAANSGSRCAPCLSESSDSEIASCARPRSGEERKESAPADECTGVPFSLGTFSWALKRKYLARMGETRRGLINGRAPFQLSRRGRRSYTKSMRQCRIALAKRSYTKRRFNSLEMWRPV